MLPLHNTEFNSLIAFFYLLLRDILEILHLPFTSWCLFICLRVRTGKTAIQSTKTGVELERPRDNLV